MILVYGIISLITWAFFFFGLNNLSLDFKEKLLIVALGIFWPITWFIFAPYCFYDVRKEKVKSDYRYMKWKLEGKKR